MVSLVAIDIKKEDILILAKSPTDGLDNTTLTAEKKYYIDFTEQQNKFWLGLHYNRSNSHIFANRVELYKLKAKDSEINATRLRSDIISKDFLVDIKKDQIIWYAYDFSIHYDSIDVDEILDIHKYLRKKNEMKQ